MDVFQEDFLEFDFGLNDYNEKETNIFSSENTSEKDQKMIEFKTAFTNKYQSVGFIDEKFDY